jgi:OOP family OmpA-OmpF porin
MKQVFTIFCFVAAMLLFQKEAFAQPKHGFTYRMLWYNYVNPSPAWSDWSDVFDTDGRGFELAYNRKIQKNTYLVVPVKFGVGKYADENGVFGNNGVLMGNLDALIQYNLFKYGSVLNPTLHLGAGSTWDTDNKNVDFNLPAGIGFNLRLMDNVYLNAQSQYRFSLENRGGWHHGAGFVIYFGDDGPKDRDKDGVTDDMDKCPDVFGVASLAGCPDRDGDGITDADDKCPDVPGVAALAGCPDRDGDGIGDAEDACPDEKGIAAFKGCPDTDNDGIEDKNDKCPREAGPASNQGCPVRDRDGDGIADADDACPTEKGPAATKGCPDRDGDLVVDKDDACPDKKGDPAHKGCPDTDADGVYDNDDRCIDKPGPASNKGCPEIKKEDKAKVELAVKAVQFETGKATLLASSTKILDDVAAVLVKYPEYSLNIGGHTDDVGDDKMNQDLSERRAKTVYDYLVAKSVAAARMMHAGYGETKPVADNKTKAGRDTNRRVEFDLFIK